VTTPNGPAPASFSKRDMETILTIIDNQPLQNMKVARELQALQNRFVLFCSLHLPQPEAPKPDKPGRKAKSDDVNPAS
jgi:hypothetical protein